MDGEEGLGSGDNVVMGREGGGCQKGDKEKRRVKGDLDKKTRW